MPNRLASQTSPYLLQHAGNPVDWHPWDQEALERARREDRPILLSIGYSACHWCHVMAHESFEDPEVAAEMNRHFVNVKVDREERPDLDQIYQTAHAMLTRRSGGWPLTLFLMPDGTPFFGGTYFPKHGRHGMPGFLDLLPRVAAAYREQRAGIAQQNAALMEALARTLPAAGPQWAPDRAPLAAAVREFERLFDPVHGGIGRAPKFPHPFELAYCLRRHTLDGDDAALEIARLTLTRMAEGGICDQLGGGFCRYSVDEYWSVPHFEKMLYDNAALLALYSDAWLVTGEPLLEGAARGIAGWVLREMQSPDGGYYSSLDADSEHEEGKYYVWTREQVAAVLTPHEYAVAELHYGLDGPPNFEGRWNLRIMKPVATVAHRLQLSQEACAETLAHAREKLLAAREHRVRPGRDDKILTSWNALMVRGMARAARALGEPAWLASARRALDFIGSALWRPAPAGGGRLLATCKDGVAHLNAYLDDYAFLLDALLETMQAGFREQDLDFARDIAEVLLARFEDGAAGGFFFVSHDHEQLIFRAKSGHDQATPSGNGVAAVALQRLGHLLGEPRYLRAAERTLELYYPEMESGPAAFVSLATALDEYLSPPRIAILRGDAGEMARWHAALARDYRPDTLVLAVPRQAGRLPPVLDKGPVPDAGAQAWVCHGAACLPPVADLDALQRALAAAPASPPSGA